MLFHFMNSDMNKEAQALKVAFSRKTNLYHSQTCFNKILRVYLNKKLNFYDHIIERSVQMHIRSENLNKVKHKTNLLKLYKQKLFGNLFHHQC